MSCGWQGAYFGAVAGACFGKFRIQWSPVTISPPLNGGTDFAGNNGRKTANVCETNAMETIMIAAAYFMSRGLTKMRLRDKKKFLRSRDN